MPGRDDQFQRELRAQELAAKNGAAEQSARQQAMANALANRTLTEITLQGVEVFLFRMVDEEGEFQGVTLAFVDRAFNKRYTYVMQGESAKGFSSDFADVIAGGEMLDAALHSEEDGQVNLDV